MKISAEDVKRFNKKIVEDKTTGCWVWRSKTSSGYPTFRIGKIVVKASRFAYTVQYGSPGKLYVCHHCKKTTWWTWLKKEEELLERSTVNCQTRKPYV